MAQFRLETSELGKPELWTIFFPLLPLSLSGLLLLSSQYLSFLYHPHIQYCGSNH